MTKPKRVGNYRGRKTTVEPIRFSRQLLLISQILKDKPRDLAIFVFGINSGLRMADILNLRVHQIRDVPVNGVVRLTETKTKKKNILIVNSAIHKALHAYLATVDYADDDYLFKTKYGKKMTSVYAGRLVQDWVQKIGIDQGVYGCHSLRKTWAYHMRIKFNVDWSLITTRLNHSNPIITRRYLGIEESEVITILKNIIE